MSGAALNTSALEQELASLNLQIEKVQGVLTELGSEMRVTEAELETFSAERLRFDAMRDACNALARLEELEASQLFWGDIAEVKDVSGHIERVQSRIALFDSEIRGVLERHTHLKTQLEQREEELDYLYDDIRNAYAREERRKDEFVIEREISAVPQRVSVMPWSYDSEGERRYRRSVLLALLLSFLLSGIVYLVKLPPIPRPVVAVVPERLAKLIRKEERKPEPVKKPKEEKKEKKKEEKAKETPKEEQIKPAPAEKVAARAKAETSGVMAFKNSFKDLLEETPVAKLGLEAHVNKPSLQTAGAAQASRSLVAMEAGGGPNSGGINNAAVSRNIGSGNRAGGGASGIARQGGFGRVQSSIAGLAAKQAKSLSSGGHPGRTDEEIQILFDRYKAALYRIYNTALRKDPTLRGKMVLRIAIEPSGVVSACSVQSSNMNAPEFSAQIVDRVKKFNFGAKDGVPKITILYPIDFLPAD